MSTHASILVDSVGPPSAEVCRAAASFPLSGSPKVYRTAVLQLQWLAQMALSSLLLPLHAPTPIPTLLADDCHVSL
jgi:hypothetical protein